ncbi:MAG: radical SAM/SPASM domain-containing protein [Promethearchaeota archaeon]
MFNQILSFLRRWKFPLINKLPLIIKIWLYYISRSIKEISHLIKSPFLDYVTFQPKKKISLDLSTICQLKCPVCPTSIGINKKGVVGQGYLKFLDFKDFINKNPSIKRIELSNWGEIFLNPDLKSILKYSFIKNIELTVNNGVNLNNASRELIKSIVKYKVKSMNISLDGATEKTYKIYRRNGNFNEVLKNIRIINYYKRKYHSEFPKLTWQFIIFGHNEHELLAAKDMARNLGMDLYIKYNRYSSFSPIKNKEFIRKESKKGVATREEYVHKYRKPYCPACIQLWRSPQINWDGKLLGCCYNIWGDYGNVFDSSFDDCLKSERYIYTKKLLLGKVEIRDDIPCYYCHNYKVIKEIPLKKREIILNYFL